MGQEETELGTAACTVQQINLQAAVSVMFSFLTSLLLAYWQLVSLKVRP